MKSGSGLKISENSCLDLFGMNWYEDFLWSFSQDHAIHRREGHRHQTAPKSGAPGADPTDTAGAVVSALMSELETLERLNAPRRTADASSPQTAGTGGPRRWRALRAELEPWRGARHGVSGVRWWIC